MDTYYLWDPSHPMTAINIGMQVADGFESAFVVTVAPGAWRQALTDLQALAARAGKKRHLEIHCHGGPGYLSLGGKIDIDTVEAFGRRLATMLQAGGFIELLSCAVAAQDGDPCAAAVFSAPPARIAGYRDDYHGVLRREHRARTTGFVGPRSARGRNARVELGIMAEEEDPTYSYFTPDAKADGLAFCLALARTSRCRVRAATTTQWEENAKADGPLESPIGNWENEVFDFYPSGKVRYVGFNVSRGPVMRSYELGVTRPA